MTSTETHLIRKFKGSRFLEVKNTTAIASDGFENINLDDRFEPYDDVVLFNANSDNDCLAIINHGHEFFFPKANSTKINMPVEEIRIKNIGITALNIGDIKIIYRNTGWQGKEIINKASSIISNLGFLKILRG